MSWQARMYAGGQRYSTLNPDINYAYTKTYEMNLSLFRDAFQLVGEQVNSLWGNAQHGLRQVLNDATSPEVSFFDFFENHIKHHLDNLFDGYFHGEKWLFSLFLNICSGIAPAYCLSRLVHTGYRVVIPIVHNPLIRVLYVVFIYYLILLIYAVVFPINTIFMIPYLFVQMLFYFHSQRMQTQSGKSKLNVGDYFEEEQMVTQSVQSYISGKTPNLDSKEAVFCREICICVFHIYKNRDASHIFASVSNFLLRYYKFDEMQKIIEAIMDSLSETQSLARARQFLDGWKNANDSDLARQTQRVVLGVVSSGVLATMGLTFSSEGLFSYLNTRPTSVRFNSISDMAHSVCDLVLTFAETGYECFVERSLQPILCRDRLCRNWIEECVSIVRKLEVSPTQIHFKPDECLTQIDSLLTRGAVLMASKNQVLSIYWRDLSQRRLALIASHNIAPSRKAPFSLLIYGKPGIGKTAIINILASHFQKVMVSRKLDPALKWDPNKNMYTRNPNDEFYSGYQGAVHWCFVMDDLARESPTQVKNGQATSIKDCIEIINTVGICTNQAELSKKGTVPLLPKLVLATTNTKDLNARLAVAQPAAVLRRFPFVITPYLKPEFVDPVTKTMKKLKVVEKDAWVFDLELFCQTEHSYEYKMIEEKCSMGTLQVYLADRIEEHFRSATMMLESMRPDDEQLCPHGSMKMYCAECEEIVEFDALITSEIGKVVETTEVSEATETQSLFSYFRPKELTFRERLVANCIYYAGKHAPFWAYSRLVQRIGIYSISVRESVDDIFRDNIPFTVRVMQYAFGALLSFSFVFFIASFISGGRMECQSDETVNDDSDKKNYWATKKQKNEDFIVPTTSRKGNLEELKRSLEKSMVRLVIKQDGVDCEVSAIYLKNNWYATVGHIFPAGNAPIRCLVTFGRCYGKCAPVYSVTLDRSNIYILDNDLAVFQTGCIIPRKEIWNFLPEHLDESGRDCYSINFIEGELEQGQVQTVQMTYSENQHTDGSLIKGRFMRGWRLDRKPVRGDCGSVIIGEAHGKYFISGLHCAGTPHSMFASRGYKLLSTQISKSILSAHIDKESIFTMSGYSRPLKLENGSRRSGNLGEPNYKGIHCWADISATMLGSYPGRIRSSSKVKHTLVKEYVEEAFNMKLEYGPPLMVPIQNANGDWLNPFTIAAEAQGNIPGEFNEAEIEFVARGFLADLLHNKSWLKDTGIVSLDIAVNGISGDPWINRLPMSTSGGFYFPGPKKKYFERLDEETYKPNDEVLSLVDSIEESYALGQRANVVFNGTLKDEATKQSKIDSGKTRVFTACDVAFSLVVRKQYLRITKAFMKNNFITECAVGMNCYSEDWGKLYEYLTPFGEDRIIAGDFSNYDKRMPAIFIRAAFWILDQCRSRLKNLSRKNALIGRGIATDISFPITNLNGDVFQFAGGNSSGHPLTVIINSIVNSLYMRFAYHSLGYTLSNFRRDVKLMTLGDDNIMGSGVDGFNHTNIQKILKAHGVPYTMADKESKSTAFIHISKADFLKRHFRMNEYRIVGPLALKSVFKSLCFYVVKDNISKYEHFAQCYLAARREWSLHGADIFNNCVEKMESIILKDNISRVQDFFIPAHSFDYDQTLRWVLELEDVN